MDITIKRCDRCNSKDAKLFVFAAADGQDAHVDFCSNCTALLLRRLLGMIDAVRRADVVAEILAYRKAGNIAA